MRLYNYYKLLKEICRAKLPKAFVDVAGRALKNFFAIHSEQKAFIELKRFI